MPNKQNSNQRQCKTFIFLLRTFSATRNLRPPSQSYKNTKLPLSCLLIRTEKQIFIQVRASYIFYHSLILCYPTSTQEQPKDDTKKVMAKKVMANNVVNIINIKSTKYEKLSPT